MTNMDQPAAVSEADGRVTVEQVDHDWLADAFEAVGARTSAAMLRVGEVGAINSRVVVEHVARCRLAPLAGPVQEPFLDQLRRVNTERYEKWVEGADAGIMFDALELGGEVGELLNVVKKLEREERGLCGSPADPADFAAECADVLICLDKLARRRGVDLTLATIAKFNTTSEKVGLPHMLIATTPLPAISEPGEMTAEEHRLEDLKQMAAYTGPIVSFDVREPYYLASCDRCGWVGSSELCGTDNGQDDSDVYCPRCQTSGADCGKVAERIVPAIGEAVAWCSPGQLANLTDLDADGGVYLPIRKTKRGNFTMPLYAVSEIKEAGAQKWPDIGADPMKGDRSDRYNAAAAACREAYVRQQPHVPDQTALVWRWHLGALLEDHLRLAVLLSRERPVDDATAAGSNEIERHDAQRAMGLIAEATTLEEAQTTAVAFLGGAA